MLPQTPKRRDVAGERRGRLRAHHLPAVRDRHQPRRTIHRRAEVVPVALGGLTRVHTDPHPDRRTLRPRLRGQRLLHRDRRRQRITGPTERGVHAVAGRLHDVPAVRLDRRPHQRVVTFQRRPHRVRHRLPQLRRTLDIREQERHGPRRRLRHQRTLRPSGWTVPTSCRRTVRQTCCPAGVAELTPLVASAMAAASAERCGRPGPGGCSRRTVTSVALMSDIDHAAVYRAVRVRITALVCELPEETLDRVAPATPEWRVRDVVAHLAGSTADIVSGNLDDVASDEWTARSGRCPEGHPDRRGARRVGTLQCDRRADDRDVRPDDAGDAVDRRGHP